jgi:hypothetical protein
MSRAGWLLLALGRASWPLEAGPWPARLTGASQ